MKPKIFHHAADEEYVDAVQYYAGISLELGNRFYDEMESLIQEVCISPKRFWKFDPPARRHLSHLMHMKRRPGYWRGRLA